MKHSSFDEVARQIADDLLTRMYRRARAQFGDIIKGFWLYDEDPCPGCGFPIDVPVHEGRQAISLNVFIYRPRGILIGYMLCSRCARQIFDAIHANPGIQTTPLHAVIEQNLITAYQRYLASLDA